MPVPRSCPHLSCVNHESPPPEWYVHYGYYRCRAHGTVQRYRCRSCRRTCSDQSESPHYFAKRRVPLHAVWDSLLGGASLREIARRYSLSCPAIGNALLRLGRQAMAAHITLLAELQPRNAIVYDGLRSFLTSQDYPCDITTAVEPEGQTILTMTHSLMRRGGSMTRAQRERVNRKYRVWTPRPGAMSEDIGLLTRELFDYLRPASASPAQIRTDEHPLYRSWVNRNPVCTHFHTAGLLSHSRTSSRAPRTMNNPLFPVNYVDRLLRHRLKEHTRETIAFGRNATMQMHRAWIFACDHNCRREYRVRQPELGCHAEQGAVSHQVVRKVKVEFFTRRIRVRRGAVPESIRRVWMAELATPPVRWRVGQSGSSIPIPAYALRDLMNGYQHAP